MRLHIGCFDCPVEGWINTDITPHIFITRVPGLPLILSKFGMMDKRRLKQHQDGVFKKVHYLNLLKRFPFCNESVEAVFSSHVFEHIQHNKMPCVLSEILRVLKPGGVMRVGVPDLGFFIRNYKPDSADEFVKAVFEIENGFEKNRHQWMYSEATLVKLLASAGFGNVEVKSYRQGKCPDLEILDNRPEHTLFVEGIKM
jgi:predicted SAM-dependent methyltransferase